LCAGFVLLEHLGMKGTILALCAVGLAAAVVESACGGRARTAVGGGLVGAAALVAGSVAMAPSRPMILHSHVFSGSRGPEHRLVVAREGASGTASVVDNLRTGERFLYTEDFLAAGTGPRYHYMRLLAHLPALLAAERERALVIGFGSGTTVASLATHAFGAIDVVEIVPEVLEVAPSFAEVNARVLDDPRLDVRVGDGRHVLDLTDRAYDVITLEPLMPYTPGAVALYTEDFYRRGRARLTSGGVFCQWIPMHGIRPEHFRMLLRSFFRVFPETAVFVFETSAIVVGAVEDLAVRPDTLAARTAEPDVAADLAVAGYGTWRHLFGSLAADPASLATWLGEGPTMTDDRPVLEFHPLPRRTATTFGSDNLDALLEMSADPSGLLVEPTPDDRREVRELGEVARLLHFATAESGRASFLTLTGRRDDAAGHARLSEASLRAAVVEAPEFPLARRALDDARFRSALARGVALLRAGDHVSARAALLSATETRPDRPLGWYWLGRAYRSDGRIDEARAAFERAVAAFERHGDSLWQLADLDERAGDLDRARAWFRRVRELDARSPLGASRTRELRERLGPVGGP